MSVTPQVGVGKDGRGGQGPLWLKPKLTASRSSVIAAGLALVLLLTLSFGSGFLRPVVPLDEGIILTYADLLNKGLLPNRDFCSLYPPGTYWVVAFVFYLLEPSLILERLVGWYYLTAIAIAIFNLCLEYGVKTAVIVALSLGLFLDRFDAAFAAYAWFGAVALLLWSVVCLRHWILAGRSGSIMLLVSGLLGGLSIIFRHDLTPAVLLSGLAVIGFTRRPMATYATGLFVGTLPLLVHTLLVGPSAVIANLVTDVLLAGPGRRLPILWSNPFVWLVLATCVLPVLMWAVVSITRTQNPAKRSMLSCAAICLSVFPQAFSRSDNWHLAYVGCITFPLTVLTGLRLGRIWAGQYDAASAIGLWSRKLARPVYLMGAAGIVSLCAVVLVKSSVQLASSLNALGSNGCSNCVYNEGRWLPIATDTIALQTVIDTLENTSIRGDTLFVGTQDLSRNIYNSSYIFYLFPKLVPSQFYIEVAPGISDRVSGRTPEDMQKAKFVLLDASYSRWREPNASEVPGSTRPQQVLEAAFCLVIAREPYELYQKCIKSASN